MKLSSLLFALYQNTILLQANLLPHTAVPPFSTESQRHKIYAKAILDLATTAYDRPIYYNTLLWNSLNRVLRDGRFNRVQDIVSIIDILTSSPENNGILPTSGPQRFTCFELATRLVNHWPKKISRDVSLKSKVEMLQRRWAEDEDGLVRHLGRTIESGVVDSDTDDEL